MRLTNSVEAAARRTDLPGVRRRYLTAARPRQEVVLSAAILALVVVCALVPGPLAPYDPNRIGSGDLLAPPSPAHPMGTDEFGRDILSRIIVSARVELAVGVAGVALALIVGVPLGLISGYRGGFDAVAMRIQDGLLAFPSIIFAILIVVALGTSALSIIRSAKRVSCPLLGSAAAGVHPWAARVAGTADKTIPSAARSAIKPTGNRCFRRPASILRCEG